MNIKLWLGLFFWEAFALASAITSAFMYPGGGSWDADKSPGIFWGVFLSITFFGLAVFLLVTGAVDYFKREGEEEGEETEEDEESDQDGTEYPQED